MFLKIGHRGAKGYEPENTIKSFKKAISLGVDAIEFDVRKTKDGKLVIFHDKKVDKLTEGKGLVNNLTLDEIKELRVQGEEILTLQEALNFIGKKVKKIFVELKESGFETEVLKEIKKRKLEDRVIVISFLKDVLKTVRKLNKKIETGLIYVRHKNPIKTVLSLGANYLVAFYRFIHTRDIEKAHDNDLKVIVWTINKKSEAKEYKKKGVDGIVSDFPDILGS